MVSDVAEAITAEFPHADVLAALEEWWEAEQEDAALPGDPVMPDIMKPAVEIDSHRAIRALVTLEEVVKFTIPESAIREGGYGTFEEMKAHLVPVIASLHEKKRKKEDA